MKKNILFLSLLLLFTFQFSSSVNSQSNPKMKMGLKVAPNIAWMNPGTKGYTNDGARIGATIGFVSDFYFAENYALSTGLNFQFLNGKLRYSDSIQVEGSQGLKDGEMFRKYNFLYVEIPLLVKMKTKKFGKFSYFGQMGLGTAFRIKTTVNEHFELSTGGGSDQQFDYTEAALIKESIIIGLGTEFHVDESSRLVIGLSYSNALNNILTGKNMKSGLPEKSTLNFVELNFAFLF